MKARIVAFVLTFAIGVGLYAGATRLVQYTIERTFDRHAPFWWLFACLVSLPYLLSGRLIGKGD